jgi:hypothetical protein
MFFLWLPMYWSMYMPNTGHNLGMNISCNNEFESTVEVVQTPEPRNESVSDSNSCWTSNNTSIVSFVCNIK